MLPLYLKFVPSHAIHGSVASALFAQPRNLYPSYVKVFAGLITTAWLIAKNSTPVVPSSSVLVLTTSEVPLFAYQ